jgi:hypothetical protein
MNSLRLISSLKLIYLGLILVFFSGCEANQESINTTSVKPHSINKTIKKQKSEKPVNIPVIKPDSTQAPDTVETHDTQQKKPEIRMIRRVLNFHKKPLIT